MSPPEPGPLDLLVIGDCNPDVMVVGGDVTPAFGQQERLVEQISLEIGGSASITAVAAARLGLRVALAAAVAAGMTKINVATQLNKAYTGAVRACLAAEPALVDPRRYGAAGRGAVAAEVTRLLGVLRAAG